MASERDIERLSAYIDDELPPAERATLEADLQQDAALQAELESLRQVVDAIRAMPPIQRRRDFQLTPEMIQPKPKTPKLLFFPATLPATALTTAAAVLLIAFGGILLFQPRLGGAMAPMMDTAPASIEMTSAIDAPTIPADMTPQTQSQQGGLTDADLEQGASDDSAQLGIIDGTVGGEGTDGGAFAPSTGNVITEETEDVTTSEDQEELRFLGDANEEGEMADPDASRAFDAPPAPAIANDDNADMFSAESDDMDNAAGGAGAGFDSTEAEALEETSSDVDGEIMGDAPLNAEAPFESESDDMAMDAEADDRQVETEDTASDEIAQEPTVTPTWTVTPSSTPTNTPTPTLTPAPTDTRTAPTATVPAREDMPSDRQRSAPEISPGMLAVLLIGLGGLLLVLAMGLLIVRGRARRG
jgi:negative regulator of sigma E activity